MHLVVIGAGSTARALLRRLGERWEVTVVDRDPDRIEAARSIRSINAIVGDAADGDVLDSAGLSGATAVVAATEDDAVNLVVCRLAAEAGVTASALAADPERLADYRAIEVPAISPDRLAARRIVSELEPRRVFSAGIASGLAEGLDFRVITDSPMRGRALRDLDSERWLVVSVLRESRLIVPHGGTVLQAGDLVTVVGAREDHAEIVRAFTSGVARFPSDFGGSIGVALEGEGDLGGPVGEAAALARGSTAETITVFHRGFDVDLDPDGYRRMEQLLGRAAEVAGEVPLRTRRVEGLPSRALLGKPRDEPVGLIVVPVPVEPGRRRVAALCRAADRLDRPVLFARGSHPYERIVVPARDSPAGWAAARAGIDIGSQSGAPLTAVAVVPPPYIAGEDEHEEAVRSAARLQEEAAVQGVSVRRAVIRGNAVRGLESFVSPRTLLVLGMPGRTPSALIPGVAGHLVRRVACSVLLVPQTR
jgi:Trk K+ transport system NAD-binding subunit